MGLHINLLHEQQAQKKQAERDPLKLGILAMSGVAVLLVGWYLLKQAGVGALEGEKRAAAEVYAKLEPEVKKYNEQRAELESKVALAASVIGRIEDRFFWAPALETILRALPQTAQLNALGATSSSATSGSIRMEGLIGGIEPRAEADKVRNKLIADLGKIYNGVTADFVTLKDSPSPVKFEGTEYPAASFEITIKLEAKLTNPAPPKP